MDGGQVVWAPHPEEGYQLGLIVDVSTDTLTVEPLQGGKAVVASYDDVFPAVDEGAPDVDDNCALMYLNEATLLHNLRQRYARNQIYTYVANILLAVNPNQDIGGLYSSETIRRYNGRSLGTLPPHVFAIADKAFREMKAMKCSQSIIVSGESGAGKTESTKFILRYLTESYGAKAGLIEQRIVEANPLLESFGNAKTMRNNNSSRFGKFSEIHYNAGHAVVGGHVSHYLLEKSRICSQNAEERNYHVFYRMLAGATHNMRKALGLTDGATFAYLNPASLHDPSLHDKEEFFHLTHSMDCIGLTETEKADLFRVVAAVLHLGNITFQENTSDKKGGSVVSAGASMASLGGVAGLLGLEEAELQRSLTSRVMTTTKGGAVGTIINVPLKPDQACNARDALAKALYTRLFDHIVKRVNQCFPFDSSAHYIGVLDIAGFEYFQVNSFEQFCINYCNEKLQQFFNARILREEQELYKKESLGVSEVVYLDNQDCIDLIEQKTVGVIDLLDEECKLPKGSPQHFTDTVHTQHKNHFRLCLPRKSKLPFHRNLRDDEGLMIRHFAGAVCYMTSGFLEKNNDALHASLEQMMAVSKDDFIKHLFPDSASSLTTSMTSGSSPPSSTGHSKKLALISIGSKFRTQLNSLLEKLRTTGSSFIRCLKPNLKMEPRQFVGGQILSQLQCAGMISVLELMQGGFPSRAQFSDLYKMYQPSLPQKLSSLDPRTFCRALFRAVGMRNEDFKFGISKVFFRPGKFAEFDQIMRSDPENLHQMIARVQRWLVCTRWKKVIFGAISVQKLSRKIQLRSTSAVKVQACVRMFLAMRRHRPRFQGMVRLRQLRERIPVLAELVSSLKKDNSELVERVTGLQSAMDQSMATIKTSVTGRSSISDMHSDLLSQTESFLEELRVRQETQRHEEEEAERQRKEREERERREREERERLLREKEENEKKEREEAERLRLEREKREREEAERLRKIQEEQERERIRRAEEAARLRQLQELMERERREREEEEKRRLAEEEERKRRAELETRRLREEEETRKLLEEERRKTDQIEADRRLAEALLNQEEDVWRRRREAAEQERRDYELAVRLAQYEAKQRVIADSMSSRRPQPPQSQIARRSLQRSQRQLTSQQEAVRKKYNLTNWKYAELRDTINTSCDIDLLDACKDEFHRRLRVYHAWKERNARRNEGATPTQRPATDQVLQEAQAKNPAPPPPPRTSSVSPPPEGAPQRYFRVPFLRPGDKGTLSRQRGWWYAHFDGQWEVRQLELHPGKEPLLLVAGKNDMQMCALSLDETGLTRKQGAEILEAEFNNTWAKYGGKPYVPTSTSRRDLV